jgi:TRAP-type uncharacterized transport system substrate-binding protein
MMTKLEPPQIRATTGLELAAGIFARCSDGLDKQLSISLTAGKRESGTGRFRIGINGDIYGGLLAPVEVGTRKVDIAYVNPSAMVAMAYLGKGIYQDKLPLRVLGCFPSWDRIALVVDKNLGVKSLYDVVQRKIPLHVSTRFSGVNNATYFTIAMILSLYGFSFDQIKKWGGQIQECGRPFAPERMKALAKRSINAVFDEGVSTVGGWLDLALDNGYEIISIEPAIVRKLEQMGYTRTVLPKKRYRQLKDDALTIDFSGWALVTHKWLANNVATRPSKPSTRRKNNSVDDEARSTCAGVQ